MNRPSAEVDDVQAAPSFQLSHAGTLDDAGMLKAVLAGHCVRVAGGGDLWRLRWEGFRPQWQAFDGSWRDLGAPVWGAEAALERVRIWRRSATPKICGMRPRE